MKYNLIKIIKKKFPKLKNDKIKINSELLNDFILDSLEMMQLIDLLEKNYSFSLKKYSKKFKDFKIKNIENYINQKN